MTFDSTENFILYIRENRNPEIYNAYILANSNVIPELIKHANKEGNYPYQEYASWIMVFVSKQNPDLLKPYYNQLLDILLMSENQSVLRNLTKVIEKIRIQEYKETQFLDFLIRAIEDNSNKVALQVYSMQVLLQFIYKYNELKDEIIELVQLHSIQKSPAYSSAMRFLLKNIKKIK